MEYKRYIYIQNKQQKKTMALPHDNKSLDDIYRVGI